MENSNLSFWENDTFLNKKDVIIIGSGIVGLSAAVHLKETQPALEVLVLEQGDLPMGASTKNAGFACFGSVSELLDDLESQSEDAVFALVEKRWKGLRKLRARLGDDQIDYIENGGYELFGSTDKELFEKCQDHISRFNALLEKIIGKKTVYVQRNEVIKEFGFANVDRAILNVAEGQIHTGKMMHRLLRYATELGVVIQTGVKAKRINQNENDAEVICDNGWKLKSGHIIVATNGFTKRLLPRLDVTPARNQVLITKPIANLKVRGCFHMDKGYYYFRNIGNRILFGGGRHLAPKTEMTDEFGTTAQITDQLQKMLTEIIIPGQEFQVDYYWSGILGVGTDKAPIVQKLDDHLYAAVKLGGMGVAIGTLAGEEVADLLMKNL